MTALRNICSALEPFFLPAALCDIEAQTRVGAGGGRLTSIPTSGRGFDPVLDVGQHNGRQHRAKIAPRKCR
jgi:hypothetical protein